MICNRIIFINNYSFPTHFALQYMENKPAFPPRTISLLFTFLTEDWPPWP